MERAARFGISRIAVVSALIAVVAVAGIAIYLTSAPGRSTTGTSSSSGSVSGQSVVIAMSPSSPIIAPGQTQNYTSILVQTLGAGLSGPLAIRAFTPAGISLVIEKTSVSLADNPQSIRFELKADSNVSPGNYGVSLESRSASTPAKNQSFTVEVVPYLVTIQRLAFHPQNLTVPKGASVWWINLDSNIGCCDPGNHNAVFLSGANASSPILKLLDTWSYQFDTQAMVEYFCSIHPYMKGQVSVAG